jgi:hypothetical protein
MKEILNYIKLYTGCNDHALKRIEALLESKIQKSVFRELPSKIPIKIWAEEHAINK